jgi:hypothetical protein
MHGTQMQAPATRTWRTRTRWWEWAPEVVLVLGLGWFLVDETDAATSAFESGRAILLMAAGLVAWLVLRALLVRFVPVAAVRTAVMSVLAVGILAVVVIPAYRDHTVIEQLPVAAAVGDEARVDVPEAPTANAPAQPEAPAVAQPMLVRTGAFRGIDHRARGTVTVYTRTDGSRFVGLEDFDIQPGPDYDVYVVPGADRTDPGGGTRLDDLRGNVGTQFYEVPAGADVATGEWTVLIWCQTFDVPVANATPV